MSLVPLLDAKCSARRHGIQHDYFVSMNEQLSDLDSRCYFYVIRRKYWKTLILVGILRTSGVAQCI
jgi:hypothetical protein